MKIFLKLSMLFLIVFTFCNCEDVKEGATIDGINGNATINGLVYINNDQTTGNTTMELANAAVIRITYKAKDLSYSAQYDAPDYTVAIATTTDATGRFVAAVPTTNKGVTFTIHAEQYKTTMVRDAGSTEAYFPEQTTTVNLLIGEVKQIVLNYGNTPEIELP
ncbi:MAG: hypothetical protein JW973_13110 [Bacteroidales bacterium]|nr:hypothetical protein [Bacteroidales bacterium]